MSRMLVAMTTGSRGEILHRVREEEEMVYVRVPLVTMTTIPRGTLYNMLRRKKKKRNTIHKQHHQHHQHHLYTVITENGNISNAK